MAEFSTLKRLKSDKNKNKIELHDCICAICLDIMIEPVTMPCCHELCMPCFTTNVQETSLCCPLCRMRISSWARKAAREKKLVNQVRWTEIQKAFPHKVKKRLENNEADNSIDSEGTG